MNVEYFHVNDGHTARLQIKGLYSFLNIKLKIIKFSELYLPSQKRISFKIHEDNSFSSFTKTALATDFLNSLLMERSFHDSQLSIQIRFEHVNMKNCPNPLFKRNLYAKNFSMGPKIDSQTQGNHFQMSRAMRKCVLCHTRTTKAQISLCIRAV